MRIQMTKLFVTPLIVLLLASPSLAALRPNEPAPDFTLPDSNGNNFSLSETVGATRKEKLNGVIVSFFASWCVPCRQELPLIDSLADELKGKGIKVVLINVKEDSTAINALLSELKVRRSIVLSDRFGKVSDKYQIRFLPATFFIGGDGKIKHVIFGGIQSEKELRDSAMTLAK